jgi:hypothetical protein
MVLFEIKNFKNPNLPKFLLRTNNKVIFSSSITVKLILVIEEAAESRSELYYNEHVQSILQESSG